MYATPVVYPMSVVQNQELKFWLSINPLAPIIEAFRYSLLGVGSFEPLQLLYSAVFIGIVMVIGFLMFGKVEKTFMDTV
jgi:lipopolysaccharide transport system permease protein